VGRNAAKGEGGGRALGWARVRAGNVGPVGW